MKVLNEAQGKVEQLRNETDAMIKKKKELES